MNLQEQFQQIKKTAIAIEYSPAEKAVPRGQSKFGGRPHLPKDFKWPYYEGRDFEDVQKNRPLAFLAQINLEEVAPYDEDRQLPGRGMLYFFYELCTMKWGFDPEDEGCARVFYVDDPRDLQEIDFPKDMGEDFMMPELALSFESRMDLPDYEEIAEYAANLDWDSYDEERALCGYEEPGEEGVSKLLGYADLIQGSMLLECEEVTSGIYLGKLPVLKRRQKKAMLENSRDWVLLFQMSTVETEEYELMFGDGGSIYFYIRRQDLQAKRFDHTWLMLQCF